MLETIREFGLERLAEPHAPREEAQRRHSAYFLAAAEGRSPRAFGADLPRESVDWFVAEQDNLRASFDWFHDQPDPEPELRFAIACGKFWFHYGNWTEARRRLEAALSRAAEAQADAELRVEATVRASVLSWHLGDYEAGKALAEEARALHTQHHLSGYLPGSISLAVSEWKLGNRERAMELFESALSEARAEGDDITLAITLNNIGNSVLADRDFASARPYIEESAALHRRLGQQRRLANDLVDLGFIALAENRGDAAEPVLRESLSVVRTERSMDGLLWAVEGLAAFSLDRGDAAQAVRLLAATTRPRAEIGIAPGYFPIGEEIRERTLQAAREQLGEAAFGAAWEEGEELSLEEAGEAASRI